MLGIFRRLFDTKCKPVGVRRNRGAFRHRGRLEREIAVVNSQRWTSSAALLSFLRRRGWRTVPGETVFWCGPLTLFRGNTFALLSSRIDQDGGLTWVLAKRRPEADNVAKAVSNLNQYHRWWSEPCSTRAMTVYSRDEAWWENRPYPPFWPHIDLIDRYLRRHGWTMQTACVGQGTRAECATPAWTKRGWRIRFARHPENPFRGRFVVD